jgi:site-specific DNA-methyltransferase (cytosine-N4-specific)
MVRTLNAGGEVALPSWVEEPPDATEPGWYLRDAIIWAKPNPMPSSVTDRCTPSYETVFMLAKSARYFADMDAVREPYKETDSYKYAKHDTGKRIGGRQPGKDYEIDAQVMAPNPLGANARNVWTIATTPFADAHFATFPIELPLRCIRIGAREGDVVLDPFMGSGTVAQAAESLGRRWVGYELNPNYHALIAERTRQVGLFA